MMTVIPIKAPFLLCHVSALVSNVFGDDDDDDEPETEEEEEKEEEEEEAAAALFLGLFGRC